MSKVVVSGHAEKRFWERHGRASGWHAIGSPQELARAAWDGGVLKWVGRDMRVVKDFGGCRFVFSPDADPTRTLITFFPIVGAPK